MTYEDPIILHPVTILGWIGACSAAHDALDEIREALGIPERQEIPLIERLGYAVNDMEGTLRVAKGHSPMLAPRPEDPT